jgi:hypothetical protein
MIPNIGITLFSWLAWNAIIFRIDKDQSDDNGTEFPLKQYALQSWDNWLTSLCMVPILLWLGYKGLGIPGAFIGVDVQHLKWSDLYYLGSGFFTEAVIFVIKKWKASRK